MQYQVNIVYKIILSLTNLMALTMKMERKGIFLNTQKETTTISTVNEKTGL